VDGVVNVAQQLVVVIEVTEKVIVGVGEAVEDDVPD